MIKYYYDLEQGSPEWHAVRCGLLTASEMKLIIAPPPAVETRVKKDGEPYKQREWEPAADNDKVRAHLWELLAQRTTGYVEPSFDGWNILRGREDEMIARDLYSKTYAPVKECGFVTNDRWGFTLGYSPDGLVGADGLIECKSRIQKYQFETIATDEVPSEFMFQCQTALLVSERPWLDFNSFCGGVPMWTKRVYPDDAIQAGIITAATAFEERLEEKKLEFTEALKTARTVPTVRRIVEEMR